MDVLDRLVGTYPYQTDPEASYLVATKKEFYDYHAIPSEPNHKSGTPFRHQENFARLVESGVVDRILVLDDTGTGKTCKVVTTSERLQSLYQLGDVRGKIKRCIILVPSTILKENIVDQLVCSCTGSKYDISASSKAVTSQGIRKVITQNISVYYQVETYGKFANKLIKEFTNEQDMIDKYSNVMFYCDEIHKLNIVNAGQKWNTKAVKFDTNIKSFEDFRGVDFDKSGQARTNSQIYTLLWLLFHKIKNSIAILGSATPAINNINELSPVYNLILPENRQIPQDMDLDKADEKEIASYLIGMTSYTKALDTGIDIINEGESMEFMIDGDLYTSTKKLFYSSMSKFHSDRYRKMRDKSTGDKKFMAELRQVAKGVFPDGTTGGNPIRKRQGKSNDTFDTWIKSSQSNQYEFTPKMLDALDKEYDGIKGIDYFFGPTATAIRSTIDEQGGSFMYCEYMFGIGAVLTSLLVEYIYNKEYRQPGQQSAERYAPLIKKGRATKNDVGTKLCKVSDGQVKPITLPKRFRYAILTSETPTRQIEYILNLRNHPDNVNGEYLNFVIGSPISRDGININSLGAITIFMPSWTEASEYQARSRGIRAKSHEVRLALDREIMRQEGYSEDEIAKHRPQVKIYNHASLLDDGSHTKDYQYYVKSEIKNLKIQRVLKIAKSTSIDYYLNYPRNQRDSKDETPPYSYDYEGNIIELPKVVLEQDKGFDVSTYDVYYSKSEQDLILKHIKQMFLHQYSYTLDHIIQNLPEHRPELIIMTLTKFIESKNLIYDRYGFSHYMVISNDKLCLTRDYPIDPFNYFGSISKGLIVTTIHSLTDIATEVQTTKQLEIAKEITLTGQIADIDSLNNEAASKLLEDTITDYFINGNKSDINGEILVKFDKVYDVIPYPEATIDNVKRQRDNRVRQRGPGPKFKNPLKSEIKIDYIENENKEPVYYYHIRLTKPTNNYSQNSWLRNPKGTIRIMNSEDGIWRDADDDERAAFKAHAVSNYYSDRDTDLPIIVKIEDNKIMIQNIMAEKAKGNNVKDRDKYRGRNCLFWTIHHLCTFMAVSNLDPKDYVDDEDIPDFKTPFGGFKEDLSMLNEEQQELYFTWRSCFSNGLTIRGRKLTITTACEEVLSGLAQ